MSIAFIDIVSTVPPADGAKVISCPENNGTQGVTTYLQMVSYFASALAAIFSPISHLHAGVYSVVAHTHTGVYALLDHDHDSLVGDDITITYDGGLTVNGAGFSSGGAFVLHDDGDRGVYGETTAIYCGNGTGSEWMMLCRHSDYSLGWAVLFPDSANHKLIAYQYDTYASSIEWKKDVEILTGSLDKIRSIDGIKFTHDKPGTPLDGVEAIGISFEDLESLNLPGLTGRDEAGKPYGIDKTQLIPVLVQAIKELDARISLLEKKEIL